ncbi:hypothetical protein AMS68_002670 [Peltaster fructicola]|uniref:Mid2 domain-containing protein n=1 Tax=Peltaster fructicola TaxID=286661 RepID=A0A6H0XR21_9PEZI|nr:hypothetical protein AMS68_002670 [Peltaster fructicola]
MAGSPSFRWLMLSFLRLCLADDPNNKFFNPASTGQGTGWAADMVWEQGSTQLVSWTTTWQGPYTVDIWQQSLSKKQAFNSSTLWSTSSAPGQQSFQWTVAAPNSDISYSPVFFLWVHGTNSGIDISSWYFNISTPVASSSIVASTTSSSSISLASTGTSVSTSAIITLTSTTLASTTITSSISTPTSSSTGTTDAAAASTSLAFVNNQAGSSTSSNESTVTKVALGVGLGIGIPLVLILATWVILSMLRSRRQTAPSYAANEKYPQQPPVYGYGHMMEAQEVEGEHAYRELPVQRDPYELEVPLPPEK